MDEKAGQKKIAVRASETAAFSTPIWKPGEHWENADVSLDLLQRIARVVGAQNPTALQKRTFPKHPMDITLFLIVVMFEDYLQRLKYDRSAQKQITGVAEI